MSVPPEIKAITPPVQHSEGPVWDEESDILYYVDTFTATAYRWNYNDNNIKSFKLEKNDSIAVIIPIKNKQNQFIIGADRCLYKLIWPDDDDTQIKPHLQELLAIESDKPCNQYNDGKVDNKGRLWLGTLTRNADLSVEPNGGCLYMIEANRSICYHRKISNTSISNGLVWSGDYKYLYFIDSVTRTIVSYDFNEATGNLGTKRTIFDLENYPELKGIPDGMTIDNNDNLWVALFGGHSIINVDSKTSELIRVVTMPVTYVTSVCFGGPDLNILYVTTSRLHLDSDKIKEETFAGSVFAVSNLGVKGVPTNNFLLN